MCALSFRSFSLVQLLLFVFYISWISLKIFRDEIIDQSVYYLIFICMCTQYQLAKSATSCNHNGTRYQGLYAVFVQMRFILHFLFFIFGLFRFFQFLFLSSTVLKLIYLEICTLMWSINIICNDPSLEFHFNHLWTSDVASLKFKEIDINRKHLSFSIYIFQQMWHENSFTPFESNQTVYYFACMAPKCSKRHPFRIYAPFSHISHLKGFSPKAPKQICCLRYLNAVVFVMAHTSLIHYSFSPRVGCFCLLIPRNAVPMFIPISFLVLPWCSTQWNH